MPTFVPVYECVKQLKTKRIRSESRVRVRMARFSRCFH